MTVKCEKQGCIKEAVNTLRFTDVYRTDVDTDHPVRLCEEHSEQVKRFSPTDVAGVKKWLDSAESL